MNTTAESRQLWKKIFVLLPQRQKLGFFIILLILAVSAALSQITPLAIGYLTDHVLAEQNIAFASVIPILLGILAGSSSALQAPAAAANRPLSRSSTSWNRHPGAFFWAAPGWTDCPALNWPTTSPWFPRRPF